MPHVFRITVTHVDGTHEIHKGIESLEKAQELATEWLGYNPQWVENPYSAVGNYGGKLEIEEQPAELTEEEQKLWEAIVYSWTYNAEELWWEAHAPDPHYPVVAYHPPCARAARGKTVEKIDKLLDALIEKGFISGKNKPNPEYWDAEKKCAKYWYDAWVKNQSTPVPNIWEFPKEIWS